MTNVLRVPGSRFRPLAARPTLRAVLARCHRSPSARPGRPSRPGSRLSGVDQRRDETRRGDVPRFASSQGGASPLSGDTPGEEPPPGRTQRRGRRRGGTFLAGGWCIPGIELRRRAFRRARRSLLPHENPRFVVLPPAGGHQSLLLPARPSAPPARPSSVRLRWSRSRASSELLPLWSSRAPVVTLRCGPSLRCGKSVFPVGCVARSPRTGDAPTPFSV